jgi:hypothetical protein
MLLPWSCQSLPSVVRVRTYSRCDLIKSFSCYRPGLVRAHHQLSESARIVAMILSEVSHAIALVFSDPTVSCQSPHI